MKILGRTLRRKPQSPTLVAILEVSVLLYSSSVTTEGAGCAGALDTTFQTAGRFPTLWRSFPPTLALKVQPDGKIVIADGFTDTPGQPIIWSAPIRFNADGSLDTTYDPNPADVTPHTRVVLDGGRTVLISGGPKLARQNPDGSSDASFTPELPENFVPNAVALHAGGGVLVAGGTVHTAEMAGLRKTWVENAVLLLDQDGKRDASFIPPRLDVLPGSTDGGGCLVRDIVVAPDGRIYICGFFTRVNGTRRTDVARLNPTGTLDLSFEPDISVCVGCDIDAQDTVSALGIGPDGKLVIAGRFDIINGLPAHAVARLHTMEDSCVGVLTFSTNCVRVSETNSQGTVTVFREGAAASAVTVLCETFTNAFADYPEATAGRDYLAQVGILEFRPGETTKTFTIQLRDDTVCEPNRRIWLRLADPLGGPLLRYPTETSLLVMDDEAEDRPGNVDTGFEPKLNYFSTFSTARALAVGPTNIWVSGWFDKVDDLQRDGFARLDLDGRVDPTFNPAVNGSVWALTRDPGSGAVLAGGDFTSVNGRSCPGIARFDRDGTPDETFHPTGVDKVISIALELDGHILLGGGFGLARVDSSGAADLAFHSGDYTWTNAATRMQGTVSTIALQGDGRIIVGGFFYGVDGKAVRDLARLKPNGALDESFKPLGADAGYISVYKVAVQPDQKILAAGYFENVKSLYHVGLVRLNPDGSLDSTFAPAAQGMVQDFVLQPDGKILLVIAYNDPGNYGKERRGVVRLLPDGSIDPAFFVAPVPSTFQGYALALQKNGDVLLAGTPQEVNGFAQTGLVRLHGDLTGARPHDKGCITFSAPQYSVSEDAGVAAVRIQRVWGTEGRLIARLTTRDNTAVAGADYRAVSTWVAFADGDASDKVTQIPILDDMLGGGDKTAGLVLAPAANGTTLGTFGDSSLNIIENDEIVEFDSPIYVSSESEGGVRVKFEANGKRDVPVTVRYWTSDGTAKAGQDYTATSGTVTLSGAGYGSLPLIPMINDTVREPAKTFTVGLEIVNGNARLGTTKTATVYIVDDEDRAPLIVQQPTGLTRLEGQAATMRVMAAGKEPLQYQWFFEGGEIAGANGAELTLTNLQAAQSGFYEALVWDADGSAKSDKARLDVLPIPSGPGTVDVTFDLTGGGALCGFSGTYDVVTALAVEPDGDVVVGGHFEQLNGIRCNGLVRLKSDGSIDPSFVLTPYPWMWGGVNALALTPQGKILVAFDREIDIAAGRFCGVLQLNSDGTLDTAFHSPTNVDYWFLNALAVQPDGKVLIGGVIDTHGEPQYHHIFRSNADGSLDTTFKPVPLESDGEPRNAVNNILVEPDGKIVLLGGFHASDTNGGLVRLLPDGTIDSGFKCETSFWTESSYCLARQPDGKLLIGAWARETPPHGNLRRLDPNGSVDTNYNPELIDRVISAMALLPDGSLLLSTNQYEGGGIIRLGGGGKVDSSFHATLQPAEHGYISAMVALPNGQVLIGGRFAGVNGYPAANVARLNTGVPEPCRLGAKPSRGGKVVLQLFSPAGSRVQVEASSDLRQWTATDVVTNTTGRLEFAPAGADSFAQRFYRARKLD